MKKIHRLLVHQVIHYNNVPINEAHIAKKTSIMINTDCEFKKEKEKFVIFNPKN